MTQNQAMHVRTENVLKTRSLEGKIPSQVVGNVGLASRATDDSLIPVTISRW